MATYTASASGPFKIKDFWPVAKKGDELILEDGIYKGPDSMIKPPSGLSGDSGAPITIRAKTDGAVRIDGEGSNAPILLIKNKWLNIAGINACNSDGAVVYAFQSEDSLLQRICAWHAGVGNYHVFSLDGSRRVTVEDFSGWGRGRKIWEGYNGSGNEFRRGWGETQADNNGAVAEGTYASTATTHENCIGTVRLQPNSPSNPRVFAWTGASSGNDDSAFIGCIAYALSNANYNPSDDQILFSSSGGAGYIDLGGVDLVGYIASSLTKAKTFSMNDVTTGFLNKITAIGGHQPSFGNWTLQTPPLIFPTAVNIYDNPLGANVLKCYINRTLTEDFLFPWRMDERIRQGRVDSGFPTVTAGLPVDNGLVTTLIEQLFGVIKPEWRWDYTPGTEPPVPPEPTHPQRRKFRRRKEDR